MTPWTVALPGSSVHGIFQARILEQAATFLEGRKAEYYSAFLMIHKMYSVFKLILIQERLPESKSELISSSIWSSR